MAIAARPAHTPEPVPASLQVGMCCAGNGAATAIAAATVVAGYCS